jgi:hypothetical protein
MDPDSDSESGSTDPIESGSATLFPGARNSVPVLYLEASTVFIRFGRRTQKPRGVVGGGDR